MMTLPKPPTDLEPTRVLVQEHPRWALGMAAVGAALVALGFVLGVVVATL
jgi:hypothetical protein